MTYVIFFSDKKKKTPSNQGIPVLELTLIFIIYRGQWGRQ